MKRFSKLFYTSLLLTLFTLVTTIAEASVKPACVWVGYQPEVPKALRK